MNHDPEAIIYQMPGVFMLDGCGFLWFEKAGCCAAHSWFVFENVARCDDCGELMPLFLANEVSLDFPRPGRPPNPLNCRTLDRRQVQDLIHQYVTEFLVEEAKGKLL